MLPKTLLLTAAFAATAPIANWMIGNVGTECIPNGPCLIPVGFGLHAPSGVLMIGVALVLRDMVHETGGWRAALLAILLGAVLSWFVAPPALVMASVAAFVLAEFADLAVYAPLRERRLVLAILASGIVGSLVDSAVFLWLAFGSLDFITGQVLGKLWMSVAAAGVLLGMSSIRWWLFKRISELGWWICPEPHKSRLQRVMPTKDQIRREYALSELAELDRDIWDAQ